MKVIIFLRLPRSQTGLMASPFHPRCRLWEATTPTCPVPAPLYRHGIQHIGSVVARVTGKIQFSDSSLSVPPHCKRLFCISRAGSLTHTHLGYCTVSGKGSTLGGARNKKFHMAKEIFKFENLTYHAQNSKHNLDKFNRFASRARFAKATS